MELYNSIGDVVDDIDVLQEFFKEGEATEDEVDARYQEAMDIIGEVEFKATLDKEEDELGAFLEINAGAGGTEACARHHHHVRPDSAP